MVAMMLLQRGGQTQDQNQNQNYNGNDMIGNELMQIMMQLMMGGCDPSTNGNDMIGTCLASPSRPSAN
ncbi:hypothetical protein Y886_20250 [Xanthomonas hyacinthi DSM 19077]|nr:hypothetical protein Y886_20250 [Xanthomonas hyacinthi DSM 19077]